MNTIECKFVKQTLVMLDTVHAITIIVESVKIMELIASNVRRTYIIICNI